MFNICSENDLVFDNYLKTVGRHFISENTYRKRDTWISQLNICVVSMNLLKCIKDFNALQRYDLPIPTMARLR